MGVRLLDTVVLVRSLPEVGLVAGGVGVVVELWSPDAVQVEFLPWQGRGSTVAPVPVTCLRVLDDGDMSDQERLVAAEAAFAVFDREECVMSYLRGNTYIWPSRDHVHVWVHDGEDGWRESGWAVGAGNDASGVAIEQETMDEYVMMRVAELVQQGRAVVAAERAIAAHRGNGGCMALEATWDVLREKIQPTT